MNYQIIRSNRKTVAIQITPKGEVLVRCPRRMPDREVHKLVVSKAPWIEKNLSALAAQPLEPPLSEAELRDLRNRAAEVLPLRAAYFAPIVGVDYGSITIRTQRSRWGSCSILGNLSFNCLLMLSPPSVQDYVVVHELCHRLHMDHSQAFWDRVGRVLPNYRREKAWLKEHGPALIRRI